MKIAAFSDCHWLYKDIKKFPKADILIFAGDWCGNGFYMEETTSFIEWFKNLPYRNKVVIPGNHDRFCEWNFSLCKDLFKQADAHLLVDEKINIEGVSIYGTPWCTEFNGWAFMRPESELKEIYKRIPNNLDILVTHTPPMGICDPSNYGSDELRKRLNNVDYKIHICGHNHGGYGVHNSINKSTYNVSVCSDADKEHDYDYKLINPITVIKYED